MAVTIAIPTYNRNIKLKRTVELLLPQLNPQIKLKIFDNCSDIPVSETLKDILDSGIEIERNKINIGMSGNFIKCFESCDTEWLWMLGDDDPPCANAIQIIEDVINSNANCSFINFKTITMAKDRNQSFFVNDCDELIDRIDSFGNLLYISVGLYNLKKLSSGYKTMYQYSYTLAPHMALLLSALSNSSNHKVLFSDKVIINSMAHDTNHDESWNWIVVSMAIFLLYETVFNVSHKSKVKLKKHLKTHVVGPKEMYSEIARFDPFLKNYEQDKYWYDQVFMRAKIAMTAKDWFYFLFYKLKLAFKYYIMKLRGKNKHNQELITTVYKRI
ncbi:glycosyltransferase family 2 protein [Rufibacter tibetensis]|uniref:Glycosyltransferase 2-like domain-containing protein n=1 Tax=Rufibacter tibetensis TaxID=512763 RepID=A0A0P0C4I6_9BACT|nr:glycosyltransferase family 2 protein [Rufibacter tibetensis]ALI99758.1 hypothetical protein DC20_13215 [Rufibacter tibetensis]